MTFLLPVRSHTDFDIVARDNNSFWADFTRRWNCQFVWFSQRRAAFQNVMKFIPCFRCKRDRLFMHESQPIYCFHFPFFSCLFRRWTLRARKLYYSTARDIRRQEQANIEMQAQMHIHTNTQGSTWPAVVLFSSHCNYCSIERSPAISSSFYTSYN